MQIPEPALAAARVRLQQAPAGAGPWAQARGPLGSMAVLAARRQPAGLRMAAVVRARWVAAQAP